jgi:hypothetical protein
LLASLPSGGEAQTAGLGGRIIDRKTKQPITGAHVKLTNQSDTSQTFLTTTGTDGAFRFPALPQRTYALEATFVGYAPLLRTYTLDKRTIDLGDLVMSESAIPQPEVVVQGKVPPAVQKTDTTEYNAGAFKTHPDATAEDLVAKMPGVTVDNGSVKAQGEDVGQVLVDGKPFFGNDPTLALRNLPADAIEKIQVFDKMSDQAEFTGFDDGQSVKTINMITRRDKRNQQFGKSYGGYGDAGKYLTGGGFNLFHNDTRLSVIGISNNVNQQNFSQQDLLGVLGNSNQRGFSAGGGFSGRRTRGGGGGGGFGGGGGGQFQGGSGNASNFLVGQQNGITTTNSIGTNYTDSWGSQLAVSQSYFFNLADGQNDQALRRQYFGTPDSTVLYNEHTGGQTRNSNHRIDSRIEYTMDSSNSLIVQPRLYFQNNSSSSLLTGVNTLATAQLINQTETNSETQTSGFNLSNRVVFRHKFASPGRTVSLDVGMGLNRKRGSGTLRSTSGFFLVSSAVIDTLDQQTPLLTDGWSITPRLAYTEPAGGNGLLQFSYNPSYSRSESDNRSFLYDPATGAYSIPDIRLSNRFANVYSTQNAGVGYRLRATGLNLMGGVSYQVAALRGEREFPTSGKVDRTFYNILPNAMLTYNFGEHSNLRLFYRTSTKPPDISQLQDVIDNTNALLLKAGNPDLKQSFSQTLVSRYGLTSFEKGNSLFILFSASRTSDFIGNSTITATRDTVLQGGVTLNRGTQLTVPVNLDGNWNVNSFLTYGLPVALIKSNLNFTSGFTYARTPGLIGGNLNLAGVSTVSAGAVVSSNISEDVDFTLSYTGNYSVSRNTLVEDQNSNYFYHTAGVKLNLIFWEGLVFHNETTNMLYNGLSGGFNQNFVLWNLSLAKKLFENQRGELRGSVSDLLNQNTSVSRTVTETYLEDRQNEALGRYLMLSFTYTLR